MLKSKVESTERAPSVAAVAKQPVAGECRREVFFVFFAYFVLSVLMNSFVPSCTNTG